MSKIQKSREMARLRGPSKILGFEGIEVKHRHWPSWGYLNSLKLIKKHLWSKNKNDHGPHKIVLGLTNKMDHKALNQIELKGLKLNTTVTIFGCPHLTRRNWKTLTTDLRA